MEIARTRIRLLRGRLTRQDLVLRSLIGAKLTWLIGLCGLIKAGRSPKKKRSSHPTTVATGTPTPSQASTSAPTVQSAANRSSPWFPLPTPTPPRPLPRLKKLSTMLWTKSILLSSPWMRPPLALAPLLADDASGFDGAGNPEEGAGTSENENPIEVVMKSAT